MDLKSNHPFLIGTLGLIVITGLTISLHGLVSNGWWAGFGLVLTMTFLLVSLGVLASPRSPSV